jgi:hypothetical protein
MPWNDNKQPVHFKDWKPYALFGKRGWLFYHGLAQEERVAIPSYLLAKLLKEEKAYLVIDKDSWEKLVEKYRGTVPAKQASLSPEQQKALSEAKGLGEELRKVSSELASKRQQAQKALSRGDKTQETVRLAKDVNDLTNRKNSLEDRLRQLKAKFQK